MQRLLAAGNDELGPESLLDERADLDRFERSERFDVLPKS